MYDANMKFISEFKASRNKKKDKKNWTKFVFFALKIECCSIKVTSN